jgi:hypothetical protein
MKENVVSQSDTTKTSKTATAILHKLTTDKRKQNVHQPDVSFSPQV